MQYVTLDEVLKLYRRIIERYGGSYGVHNLGALESSLAQPRMTFGGEELYPTIVEKVAALGFSLIKNHPFVDRNKRIGHAAMEVFLILNGFEIDAPVDEQQRVILKLHQVSWNAKSLLIGCVLVSRRSKNDRSHKLSDLRLVEPSRTLVPGRH